METKLHQVRNHQYDIGSRHQYLSLGSIYHMFICDGAPIVKVIQIHTPEEGCFGECGLIASCHDTHNYHYILVECTQDSAIVQHLVGDRWVYHERTGGVEWKFLSHEKILSNRWMNAFVKSKRGTRCPDHV